MRSPISTDIRTPADIIAISKARSPARQSGAGAIAPVSPSGHALVLPEDVVTLSSHQSDSSSAPARTVSSLPVTPIEKKALLGSDAPPYRLSIYG